MPGMSDLLARLEGAGCSRSADQVMSILIDCHPKAGSQCDLKRVSGNAGQDRAFIAPYHIVAQRLIV